MAPTERMPKRSKLSPSQTPLPPSPGASTSVPSPIRNNASSSGRSWYSRTWPKKAAPVTQIARESISSASSTAIETASVIKDKVARPSRRSSLALTLGKSTSTKALPAEAMATKDHATSRGKGPQNKQDPTSQAGLLPPMQVISEPQPELEPQGAAMLSVPPPKDTNIPDHTIAPRSWIVWLAKGDGAQSKATSTTELQATKDTPELSQDISKPPTSLEVPAENRQTCTDQPQHGELPTPQPEEHIASAAKRRSWLPIWHNATAAQSAPAITSPAEVINTMPNGKALVNVPATTGQKPLEPSMVDVQQGSEITKQPAQAQSNTKSSAWVFWSRGKGDKGAETQSLNDVPREGEIAVADTETQAKPRRASIDLSRGLANGSAVPDTLKEPPVTSTTQKSKQTSKLNKELAISEADKKGNTTKVENKAASATATAPADAKSSRTSSPVPPKKPYEHLLLPSLHSTLKIPENPTLFQQLTKLFYASKEPELRHLSLLKDPPRIKSALAIGVHGYFPAPLIQSVLGRPTGTSIKFADMAASSIKRYTKSKGYGCTIKTAALDGEGKIAERIDLLWKLLLNWIEEIRRVDFVMVACHSQGVPVAIMLVARLIKFGCISSARVGICAMAGINLGPFPEFKSRWISGSTSELFEFSDPNSRVSKDYLAALEEVLNFGVRLTYVGSIDDQLVSMESSIFAPISHPHIYRAVSIDSRLHAPDFVSHLVAFALKLRNLGVEDHGLIRELSVPLAGSLYTGEGHSRLYEDDAIYDLAVAFALETTSLPGVPVLKRNIEVSGGNPYILPFAMRGILEEDFVKSDLQGEASLLLKQFDEWRPQTKALKDVKFRLEGIRSKL